MSKLVSVTTQKFLFPGFMANIKDILLIVHLWLGKVLVHAHTILAIKLVVFFTLRVNYKVQQMGRDADKMNYDLGAAEIIIGR